MTQIVLGRKDKIDFRTTLEEVAFLNTVNEIKAGQNRVFLEATEENIAAIDPQTHDLYVPSHQLTESQDASQNIHVYFDLENYPFYQAAQAVIEKKDKPKGVFRYRRMIKEVEEEALFASDLYILTELLGEPRDIKVRKTDAAVIPTHIIVMVNFGGGTMAHIEYTISNEERIEFEWSGTENIIEFDSEDMTPIQPKGLTSLPLTYSVDSIVSQARILDQSLLEQLATYRKLIQGGAQ